MRVTFCEHSDFVQHHHGQMFKSEVCLNKNALNVILIYCSKWSIYFMYVKMKSIYFIKMVSIYKLISTCVIFVVQLFDAILPPAR